MAPPRRPKYTQSEISAQLQQLWIYSSLSPASTEIELGPIILNIHRSRQQDAYLTALNQFVKEKEQEIEDVCTRNYQVLSHSLAVSEAALAHAALCRTLWDRYRHCSAYGRGPYPSNIASSN